MGDSVFNLVWWVFFLPLIGFLVQSLTGKIVIDNLGAKLGRWLMGALAVAPIAASFAIGALITLQLAKDPGASHIFTLFQWITVGNLSVPFELRVDTLSMTMVLIITGIGALIHLYATGYMAEERDYTRFFTYLNLFVAAMLLLVLGNNLVLLFVGWEGVGVCSYLLIGFWYKNLDNSRAANKAFIVNRIGDWGLSLGMFALMALMAAFVGNLETSDHRLFSYDVFLPQIQNLAGYYDQTVLVIIALLFFVGAMGKSAQFPLYIWLPDAMAGPTPVSALIHAATMVTSGVFLLNRMSPLFVAAPQAAAFVAVTGAVTALVGALVAFGQTDIKKVLAFSTVSQLGYMFIACGVGAYWVGIFHVATHAFFKALLFLGSGAVIHAMAHSQDMRSYGNLKKYIPITAGTMLVGWLAIAGFPFLSGAFSKEEILHQALSSHVELAGYPVSQIVFWVGLAVAVLTAAYMTRMTMLTFFSGPERWKLAADGPHHDENHHDGSHEHHDAHEHGPDTHRFFYSQAELARIESATPHEHHHGLDSAHKPREVPISMWLPLVVLAGLSLVGGWWLAHSLHLDNWLSSSVIVEKHHSEEGGSWLSEMLKSWLFYASVGAFVVGVGWGYLRYGKRLPENEGWDEAKWPYFLRAAGRQFGIDKALGQGFVNFGANVGQFFKAFDTTIVDGVVNLFGTVSAGLGKLLRSTQTGYVRGYALLMQAGALMAIGYFLWQMLKVAME